MDCIHSRLGQLADETIINDESSLLGSLLLPPPGTAKKLHGTGCVSEITLQKGIMVVKQHQTFRTGEDFLRSLTDILRSSEGSPQMRFDL